MSQPSAPSRSEAEDRFWVAYDQLLTHGAGCRDCRGPIDGQAAKTCPEGRRLFDGHQAAKRALRTETTA